MTDVRYDWQALRIIQSDRNNHLRLDRNTAGAAQNEEVPGTKRHRSGIGVAQNLDGGEAEQRKKSSPILSWLNPGRGFSI
jgi:hypothetical protein